MLSFERWDAWVRSSRALVFSETQPEWVGSKVGIPCPNKLLEWFCGFDVWGGVHQILSNVFSVMTSLCLENGTEMGISMFS